MKDKRLHVKISMQLEDRMKLHCDNKSDFAREAILEKIIRLELKGVDKRAQHDVK